MAVLELVVPRIASVSAGVFDGVCACSRPLRLFVGVVGGGTEASMSSIRGLQFGVFNPGFFKSEVRRSASIRGLQYGVFNSEAWG